MLQFSAVTRDPPDGRATMDDDATGIVVPPALKLVVLSGPDEGRQLKLSEGKTYDIGSAPSRALSDHERRVGEHVKLLMNGSTPPDLLVPPVSREEQRRAEMDAIDYVQRNLARQADELSLRDAEKWVVDNATGWRALCGEIVLAAIRLEALEQRARDFLEPIRGQHVGGLAMTTTIARFSLLGIGDPLQELRENALKDQIVSMSQIKKAQNVE